ncbi:ubiquitin carboxyl-terminal hydrolase 7-like, partial [Diaphorina citri]|uniref:Ubiquitin carboxyl-terminal hydrolase 7-like n=1 Tax=Diaphorina citri TaxID=121845 RepID=A0A3Q0JHX0_DIACI
LLDKLEIKMKGTCVEGTVPKLFEGKMISFIKCKKVNYTSSRAETFYDIQLNLEDRLKEEKNLESIKRKERNEAHLYMNVNVFLEDMFEGYQGSDLCDPDKCIPRLFKVRKNMTLDKLLEEIAKTLGYPVEQIRLWPLQTRQNNTTRPSYLDLEKDASKSVLDASTQSPWPVWVETLSPEEGGEAGGGGKKSTALPPFDKDAEVLFFFKLYEPRRKQISYLGHAYLHMTESIDKIVELVNSRAGYPASTKLVVYEEIQANMIRPLHPGARTLDSALENIMDGDILIFQKEEDGALAATGPNELPTVRDYFQ